MKTVCVITGGGSGMGLATAKILGKEHHIIIVGRTLQKLETALQELRSEGVEAESFSCDIADRQSVSKLAAYAKSIGKIASVIHATGMSPHMGKARQIMEANALGTINIHNAFYDQMEEGSCVVDVSSISGHMSPKLLTPMGIYKYSRIDVEKFMRKMMRRINLFPKKLRPFVVYAFSKNTIFCVQAAGHRVFLWAPEAEHILHRGLSKEHYKSYVKWYLFFKSNEK